MNNKTNKSNNLYKIRKKLTNFNSNICIFNKCYSKLNNKMIYNFKRNLLKIKIMFKKNKNVN